MEAWITPSLVVALVALGITVATTLYNRKRDTTGDWQKKINEMKEEWKEEYEDLKHDQEKTQDELAAAKAELGVLKTKVDLFWQTVERVMAKQFRDD